MLNVTGTDTRLIKTDSKKLEACQEKFLIVEKCVIFWAQIQKWAALSMKLTFGLTLESLVHIKKTLITNTRILSPVYHDNPACDCRGQWIRQLLVDDSSD